MQSPGEKHFIDCLSVSLSGMPRNVLTRTRRSIKSPPRSTLSQRPASPTSSPRPASTRLSVSLSPPSRSAPARTPPRQVRPGARRPARPSARGPHARAHRTRPALPLHRPLLPGNRARRLRQQQALAPLQGGAVRRGPAALLVRAPRRARPAAADRGAGATSACARAAACLRPCAAR